MELEPHLEKDAISDFTTSTTPMGSTPRPSDRHDPTPKRVALTRTRIVGAALDLVAHRGLDGLTMRAVAVALHVTPMSLYNHVADKAELIDLMADDIIGGIIEEATLDGGDWESRLRALAHRHFVAWREHPDFIKVYTDGVAVGPNGLRNMELTLTALHQGGLDDPDGAAAFEMLFHWIVSTLLIAPARAVTRTAPTTTNRPALADDRINRYFGALPIDEIPNVGAAAAHLAGDHIDFALDIIIEGLKARTVAPFPASEAHPR